MFTTAPLIFRAAGGKECFPVFIPVTLCLCQMLVNLFLNNCNASIQRQIEERANAEGSTLFFAPDEGGFTTVDKSTDFYVREDGRVVVCFPKYSIAAGAAGNVEFVIQTPEG